MTAIGPAADRSPTEQLMGLMHGPVYAAAIAAVARLGIADLVADGPKTAPELAEATGAKSELLHRLMRATEAVGVLRQGPQGAWEQTELSAMLRADAPETLRDLAIYWSDDWRVRTLAAMHRSVLTGDNAVELIFGVGAFEYLEANPEAGLNFNRAMTSFSTTEVAAIVEAYDFATFGSLVEVAGGHGLLLAAILASAPALRATLLELPQVIAETAQKPLAPYAERVSIVGGDMFAVVPPGADAYVMKRIIHDWSDDKAGQILTACRAAVNPGGKLLVIDAVVPEGPEYSTTKFLDMMMMVFSGGQERTEAEFRRLYEANGWQLDRIVPTASPMCILEGVPV